MMLLACMSSMVMLWAFGTFGRLKEVTYILIGTNWRA